MIDLPIRGEIIHAIRVLAKSPKFSKMYLSPIANCIFLKLPIRGEIIHAIRVRGKSIPHICHFWYATISFRPLKGTPKNA